MQFTKMHGLGNDFMVLDRTQQPFELSAEQIQQLANRHTGVGFDQLLVVEPRQSNQPNESVDFHYRIFNADGGEAGQCGNGARCFMQFVHDQGLSDKPRLTVSTQTGIITLTRINDQIQVDMGIPDFEPASLPFEASLAEQHDALYTMTIGDTEHQFGIVSMGNPHIVFQVQALQALDIAPLGQALQQHPAFPEQVNAGFYERLSSGHIRLRVYERGSGETQACGTGACAAVAVGFMQGLLGQQVVVELPGGQLTIDWQGPGQPLLMTGSATTVYRGSIEL